MSTPSSERTHIGIFGRSNCGKSSLLNSLTGQQFAVVSPIAGTTTDPVSKPMEINGFRVLNIKLSNIPTACKKNNHQIFTCVVVKVVLYYQSNLK
jgi:predicted GTPase